MPTKEVTPEKAPVPNATKAPVPDIPKTPTPNTPKPTSTPISPTDTPGPKSCEEVEGNCMKLSFDGENCTYDGPTDFKTGPVTLLFLNESEGIAAGNLMRHTGDETIQDMIDYIGEEPSTGTFPTWTHGLGTFQVIRSGERHTWEVVLEPGIHTMVCASPQYGIWFGTGLTVED